MWYNRHALSHWDPCHTRSTHGNLPVSIEIGIFLIQSRRRLGNTACRLGSSYCDHLGGQRGQVIYNGYDLQILVTCPLARVRASQAGCTGRGSYGELDCQIGVGGRGGGSPKQCSLNQWMKTTASSIPISNWNQMIKRLVSNIDILAKRFLMGLFTPRTKPPHYVFEHIGGHMVISKSPR